MIDGPQLKNTTYNISNTNRKPFLLNLFSLLFQIMVQVCDMKLDNSESFSEQTSAHDGGVKHSTSHLDHPSDRSFTG